MAGGEQPLDGVGDPARVGLAEVEQLDAVHLLGGIGQVEVDGERPDEADGVDGGHLGQHLGQLPFGGRGFGVHPPSSDPDPLDEVEHGLALLADDGATELGPEAPDVGADGCISSVGIHVLEGTEAP